MQQLSLFEEPPDPRPPQSVQWNLWHGCTRVSPGCVHCYMYRRDESVGRDPTVVRKTESFSLPEERLHSGPYKGRFKVSSGSCFFTCFSSDFFHKDADSWRPEVWDMIRLRRDCTFFMITKRPERMADHLPPDWGQGWEHVSIAVTCENQAMAQYRLPLYLAVPLKHRSIMVEPMLEAIDLYPFLESHAFESVSAGGESGPDARPCRFEWVLDLRRQCISSGTGFSYHQTGARLIRDGQLYEIPRKHQHSQAKKAGLDIPPHSGIVT